MIYKINKNDIIKRLDDTEVVIVDENNIKMMGSIVTEGKDYIEAEVY